MKTQATGYDEPNSMEAADGAGTVEKYRCPRCGEFANCFTLILRSLGYDARRVLDWTDHVWCEVYSKAEKRWLHADPCEAVLDKPLVYEKGWGKKLSYCIATSKDEVQDVTSRYTLAATEDEKVVLKARRREVGEDWLTNTFLNVSEEYQANYNDTEKKRLTERRLMELIEFMSPPNRALAKEELVGRQTGSLEWRLGRGELGGRGEKAEFGGSFLL